MLKKLAVLAMVSAITPAIALAATPTAYLERAEVIASGKQFKAFRVPTRDVNGKIKYYDVTVTLNVGDDGKVTNSAPVASTASPAVLTNGFVPGTYTDNQGNTCTLTSSAMNGGRLEVALSCVDGYANGILTATWATGLIPGHPFEVDLKGAGIDTISGYSNYSWGKVGNSNGSIWGCFYRNYVISARQVGSTLSLSSYGNDNFADCGMSLTTK